MSIRRNYLQAVKEYCDMQGIKLTPIRQNVLTLIYKSSHPLGAYDILRELRKSHANAEPPTVYRALEFLQLKHLIHRIDSNNTYVRCIQPDIPHQGQLLICKLCGLTNEINNADILHSIQNCIEAEGGKLSDEIIEIRVYCKKCNKRQSHCSR